MRRVRADWFRWMTRAIAACIAIQVTMSGCSRSDATEFVREERPRGITRSLPEEPSWTERLRVGGSMEDTLFQVPMTVVANAAGVFVSDIAAHRVVHFTREGELQWIFGRSGAGPAEFQSPRDMRVDSRGHVWVLDVQLGRATIITSEGALQRNINLEIDSSPTEIIPLPDGSAVVIAESRTHPIVRVDSTGRVLSRHAFPWEPFARLSGLTTQFLTASDPGGSDWFAGFSLGDGFFAFRDAEWQGYTGWYVEPVPFTMPTVTKRGDMTMTRFEKRPVGAAISVTLSPQYFYVQFDGTSEHRMRVVDRYSRQDGSYSGSFLLPYPVTRIHWHDGGLYVLRSAPYPELLYLTRDDGPLL
jgi:hypothetical protein